MAENLKVRQIEEYEGYWFYCGGGNCFMHSSKCCKKTLKWCITEKKSKIAIDFKLSEEDQDFIKLLSW